jgi:CheY-like chemotaxis protein
MSKRVLVVDDEADVRRFLTAVLEKSRSPGGRGRTWSSSIS